jgi:hypothetical protein
MYFPFVVQANFCMNLSAGAEFLRGKVPQWHSMVAAVPITRQLLQDHPAAHIRLW